MLNTIFSMFILTVQTVNLNHVYNFGPFFLKFFFGQFNLSER